MTKGTWIVYLLAIVLTGCFVSTENLPEPDKLKIAIAENLTLPFGSKDTLVYDSFIGICGNTSQNELNRYYEPHLNEQPFLNVLKKEYSGPVLVTGDSLHRVIIARFKANKSHCQSAWECFSDHKVDLRIFGRAITNNSVKIREMYGYNDQHRSYEKIFIHVDGKWRLISTVED